MTSLLFSPYELGNMTLKNRVVMAPMCQYRAGDDGLMTPWHEVHYGARAVGGVGLLILEATGVNPIGRITANDLGVWNEAQGVALRTITAFAHTQGAKVGIQLAHAGRKAAFPHPVGPSPIPFSPDHPIPQELTTTEIAQVVDAFAGAAGRVVASGFDLIEIHAAHGYLLHQFLSPLSNQRTDAYGGSPENRAHLLFQVIAAVRAQMPAAMPLSLRISASDYQEGGLSPADWLPLLRELRTAGLDILHVSSGGLLPVRPPVVYPGYQLPFASALRCPGLARIAVGILEDYALAENALNQGMADLIALGRGLLRDPYWPIHAAWQAGQSGVEIPKPYDLAYSGISARP